MTDSITQLTEEVIRFRDARNWAQFHTLKNLMESLSIEAAELLELAQWKDDAALTRDLADNPQWRQAFADECADVFVYLLTLCHAAGIDIASATRAKLKRNAEKYPIDKAYGNARKYTELSDPEEGSDR